MRSCCPIVFSFRTLLNTSSFLQHFILIEIDINTSHPQIRSETLGTDLAERWNQGRNLKCNEDSDSFVQSGLLWKIRFCIHCPLYVSRQWLFKYIFATSEKRKLIG